jgi:hypothetical protein
MEAAGTSAASVNLQQTARGNKPSSCSQPPSEPDILPHAAPRIATAHLLLQSSQMRHVARKRHERNSQKGLAVKLEGKRLPGRRAPRCEDNIKTGLKRSTRFTWLRLGPAASSCKYGQTVLHLLTSRGSGAL